MKENVKTNVEQILASYLEANNLRKTPERSAILDAAYSFNGHFSLEQLDEYLLKKNFRVSRATLYNTMRLFMTLRLVVRHRLNKGTVYEACFASGSRCWQICTMCGKTTIVRSPEISEALEKTHLRRFHKDVFSMYIYGICSTCLARQTRTKRKREEEKERELEEKRKQVEKKGKVKEKQRKAGKGLGREGRTK